jgi:hypothetical protein
MGYRLSNGESHKEIEMSDEVKQSRGSRFIEYAVKAQIALGALFLLYACAA